MTSHAGIPIGVHKSSKMKWATLALTSIMVLAAMRAFYFSNKEGFWIGLVLAFLFYLIILYNTMLVSNITLTSEEIVVENLFSIKKYRHNSYIKTTSFLPGYSKIYLLHTSYIFRNYYNSFDSTPPSESFKNHERIVNHIRQFNTSTA